MTPFEQFRLNIAAADSLLSMYRELRERRQLGARGPLDADNIELLWLPRSSVVSSLSSLDAYVHQVLFERIPHVLRRPVATIPSPLFDRLSRTLSIKTGATLRESWHLFTVPNVVERLFQELKEKDLQSLPMQSPDRLEEAFALIGHPQVFDTLGDMWPGPNVNAAYVRRRLNQFYKRRNEIAHEGDLDAQERPRQMTPDFADQCRAFTVSLVERLNRIVYDV